jgi:hypothetical protein
MPFFDWRLSWLEPLVIPEALCPEGTQLWDISLYGTCTCCQNQPDSQSGNDGKGK